MSTIPTTKTTKQEYNPKIVLAFLVKDRLNQPLVWKDYIEALAEANMLAGILVHHYGDEFIHTDLLSSLTDNFKIVEQEPTSWEQTVPAHFSLYKAYLETQGTHFILLSESCIPVSSVNNLHITLRLADMQDATLITWMAKYPRRKYAAFWNRGNRFRNINHRELPYRDIVAAEQWAILRTKEVSCLVRKEREIKDGLKNVGADNEIIWTYLKKYSDWEFKPFEGRWWYCDWSRGGKHPKTHNMVNLNEIPAESLFMRKVSLHSDCSSIKKECYCKEPSSPLQMKDSTIKIGVFIHLYYPELYKDIISYVSVLEGLGCEINYHFSLVNGVEYPKTLINKILEKGTVTYYPNMGYDIASFLKENKYHNEDGKYDYVFKIHSKGRDNWRRKLMLPLFKDIKTVINNLKTLDSPDVWAITARQKLIPNYCGDTEELEWSCNKYGFKFPGKRGPRYSSGTIYCFSKEYARYLVDMDIDFDLFEEGFLPTCNSHTHSWEFLFGIIPAKYNKKIIGV